MMFVDQVPNWVLESKFHSNDVYTLNRSDRQLLVFQCGGVWFAGGKFGVTWKLFQAVVKPKTTLRGKCHIQLSCDDKKIVETQELDTVSDDDVPVTHTEDSDDDEHDDESQQEEEDDGPLSRTPSHVPAPVPAPAAAPVSAPTEDSSSASGTKKIVKKVVKK